MKKLAMASLALSALALNAPAAQADQPTHDCRLRSVQQDTVTGQTHQGALAGVITHADTSNVSIRCRVTVNGVTVAATPVGTGPGVATTESDVSFAAGDTDVVRVCADFTSAHGSGTVCVLVGITEVPPQVVWDTLDAALGELWPLIDPVVCEVLKQITGNHPGGVVVNDQGDVYVNGELVWDCPPYEVGGPSEPPPPPSVRSAVVGYIRIVRDGSAAQPTTTWVASGALSDPNQWSCTGSGGSTSYTVTCTPLVLPVDVNYTCDVLHADIYATTAGASGRTSMDCNSDGIPEAQTGQQFGPGGYDFVWAASTMPVTAFTCTLDLAVPTVTAGCGDPGLVGIE
ncbi:MAG TPA: hypothetical protein VNA20_18055 [Frankiaceae bacterium]|nr:hypothetical protein [Frankiaceae bacterium]